MWNTIANFRENLSQIASDVLDTAEELQTDGSHHEVVEALDQPSQLRYQREAHLQAQIDWYKEEVRRLQGSESNISTQNYYFLKEKDEELLRLQEENQILKKRMSMAAAERVSWSNGDAKVQHNNSLHSRSKKGVDAQHDGTIANLQQPYLDSIGDQMSNGIASLASVKELELQIQQLRNTEKDLSSQIYAKSQAYAMLKDAHDELLKEIGNLKEALHKERADLVNANSMLQREQKATEAAEKENKQLREEKHKLSMDIEELQRRTNEDKAMENNSLIHLQEEVRQRTEELLGTDEKLEQLQITVDRLENENNQLHQRTAECLVTDEKIEQLQKIVDRLEKENTELQVELKELLQRQTQHFLPLEALREADGFHMGGTTEIADKLREAKETTDIQNRDFEMRLDAILVERDKALRDLNRLKQHLLEKEQVDSEKMDQDVERMAELEERAETSAALALQLEQALEQALKMQAEENRQNNEAMQRANEEISLLKQRLSSCMTALESKNIELSNLQTALGQYYAESEVKERLHGELIAAKKDLGTLSENLKVANREIELKLKEKEEVVEKLVHQEQKAMENQQRKTKLEEDVVKLRRALEHSMTRLNRMSSESDYYVDRRIVIKLLVTYFQRNHSKEVLDLMVRMLGFSEEDKKAIGLAQQGAGKGVVRGVFGIPGRVVGGLLKSAPSGSSLPVLPTENQSFADLWIDFLLKESEEQERRDAMLGEAETRRHLPFSPSSTERRQESGPMPNTTASKGSPLHSPQSSSGPINSSPNSSSYTSLPGLPFRTSFTTEFSGSLNRSLIELGDSAANEFSTVPLNSAASPSPLNSSHNPRRNAHS